MIPLSVNPLDGPTITVPSGTVSDNAAGRGSFGGRVDGEEAGDLVEEEHHQDVSMVLNEEMGGTWWWI
jgi:hypothetical protein